MAALLDPLRNTLDHLALDPKAREDRKYLVSMLRRLGYSEREIEQVLGWQGDGPRVIEVEYVPPGQGPAPGSFTVVDDWDPPTPVADGAVGFSVARDAGDPARAHGWLAADDDAVAHGWLPDTVEFRERGDQWDPLVPDEGTWPQDDADWADAEETAWPDDGPAAPEADELPEELPTESAPWPEAAPDAGQEQVWQDEAWPEAAPDAGQEQVWQDETWPEPSAAEQAETALPEGEGQWRVVEDDPWSETEADWAEEPLEADEVWDEPTEAQPEPQEWDAPVDYAITEPPAGAWPAPFTYEEYTLYTRTVELSTGREQRIFFFAKNEPKSGQPCPLPPGYIVETNDRTGLPFLRRDPEAESVDVSDWGEPEQEEDHEAELACLAITKAGTQCRNMPRENSKYCSVHKGWRGPRVE